MRYDVAVVELAVGEVEERTPHLIGRDARLLQAQFFPAPSAVLVSPASQIGAEREICVEEKILYGLLDTTPTALEQVVYNYSIRLAPIELDERLEQHRARCVQLDQIYEVEAVLNCYAIENNLMK